MQKQMAIPRNSVTRKLEQRDFKEATTLTIPLYTDAAYRKLLFKMAGAVKTTFTGSPVVDQLATFASLVERIDIVTAGGNVIKSVHPAILARKQLLATGNLGTRKASAGASALTPPNPTADSPFVFGTTGQYTTIAEAIELSFEDRLAIIGNETSILELRGIPSAEIRIVCRQFANIQREDDSVTVTFAENTIKIDVATVECSHLTSNVVMRESHFWEPFGGQTNERVIQLPVGGMLRGIALLCRDGDTTKKLSSNAITSLKVHINDGHLSRQPINTTFRELQDENRSRYGLNVPYASNLSYLDGFAYVDFLVNGNMATALDLSQAKSAHLIVSTAAQGEGADYSDSDVELLIHIEEYWKWRN